MTFCVYIWLHGFHFPRHYAKWVSPSLQMSRLRPREPDSFVLRLEFRPQDPQPFLLLTSW